MNRQEPFQPIYDLTDAPPDSPDATSELSKCLYCLTPGCTRHRSLNIPVPKAFRELLDLDRLNSDFDIFINITSEG